MKKLERSTLLAAGAIAAFAVCACTSNAMNVAPDAGPLTCAKPGIVTAGPADTHCQGRPAQPVHESSCTISAPSANDAGDDTSAGDDAGSGDDAGTTGDSCDYGPTLFGTSGSDDDCKYDVTWSSTELCEGSRGVTFTVKVVNKLDGTPVTGIPQGVLPEVFVPTTLDAACDDKSTHPSPSGDYLVETKAGSGVYSGAVVFDEPGQWTIRFHIHEECADVLDDSPHGHIAFRLTIP